MGRLRITKESSEYLSLAAVISANTRTNAGCRHDDMAALVNQQDT